MNTVYYFSWTGSRHSNPGLIDGTRWSARRNCPASNKRSKCCAKIRTHIFGSFLLFCLAALPAAARPMVGVTGTNQLIQFDSATPATISSTVAITGLVNGDAVEGIDFRPANGVLYALGINGSTGRIYTINLTTGVATQVGTDPFSTTLNANAFYGFDINPVEDNIRVVNSANQNLRITQYSGQLLGTDTNVTLTDQVVGLAYDRSDKSSATPTTLFGIDYSHDQLVRIGGVDGNPSPNGGVATNIGATGLSTSSLEIGFDIAEDGVAYASMATGAGHTYALYTINLGSGAATPLGNITPSGSTVIRGIAAVPSAVTNIQTGKLFSTIQAAIDDPQTLAGHTIIVNAGVFPELVTVNKNSLAIFGSKVGVDARDPSRGTNETVVRGALLSGTRTSSFHVTATGVTIDGFTMQENSNDTQYGAAIVLDKLTSGSKIRNNIIQNNIAGIILANATASNPTIIERNVFANNNNQGNFNSIAIYTDQVVAGNTLTSVSIDSNTFVNHQIAGIWLASTLSGSQSNIGISNNILTGNGNAILLFNLTAGVVTANTLNGSLASQLVVGGGVNGLDISENIIQDGLTRGIRVGDFGGGGANSNVTVASNYLTNNAGNGLEIDTVGSAYTGTLFAQYNWWGLTNGPTIASNPGGQGQTLVDPANQILYRPFLASFNDYQSNVDGFQSFPSPIFYAINAANNNLVRFNSINPGVVTSTAITGLVAGDTIIGLDFRPATGELFGLGSGSRLYVIDPATGVATQRGSDGQFSVPPGQAFGFDFNPAVDLMRVTSDFEQNFRLIPTTGARPGASNDTNLAYASGDPNFGLNVDAGGAAYTNSYFGATRTTLYDIDTAQNVLVRQGSFNGVPSPNGGQLSTVGPLGINPTDDLTRADTAFDIYSPIPGVNVAFATLTFDATTSRLYKINLVTGAATQVNAFPIGGGSPILIRALAAAPAGSFEFSAANYAVGENGLVASITINRVRGREGSVTVQFTTSDGTATGGADYTNATQTVIFDNGVISQTIQIPITNDSLDEFNETINLSLSDPRGGATIGAQNTAVLTIVDNDVATPTLNTQSSPSVALGEATFDTASLSGGSSVSAPTGTITFQLFGPNNDTCNGAPIFTSTVPVNGNGNYISGSFAPTTPGAYYWVASYSGDIDHNAAVSSTCGAPNQSITATATVLGNIATRLRVDTGDNALFAGFIITGTQPKKVIVRGIGSSLALADKLADPTIELRDSTGALVDSNDNWVDSPNKQAIIDSTIPPTNDLESAVVASLPANSSSYTAILRGVNGGTGIGVIEAYDLDRLVDSELANISTRGFVSTGDNILIAGTIVVGKNTQKVIIRAIGPSLSLLGKMADPTLELRDGQGALVDSNDNWVDSPNKQAIIDSTIPPTNDLESAIVATLNGNNSDYTAIVRGVNGTTGIAVVELYALP